MADKVAVVPVVGMGVTTSDPALSVANTILAQLGGARFIACTGSKMFVGRANGLSFRVGAGARNRSGAVTHVRVTLNAMDTYDVEFLFVRGANSAVRAYREGVYADMLQAVFTTETGFVTSLGTLGR